MQKCDKKREKGKKLSYTKRQKLRNDLIVNQITEKKLNVKLSVKKTFKDKIDVT